MSNASPSAPSPIRTSLLKNSSRYCLQIATCRELLCFRSCSSFKMLQPLLSNLATPTSSSSTSPPALQNFDLTLSLEEKDKTIHGYIEYDSNLFEQATIERLLGHFNVLLEAVAANDQLLIADLPLLTKPELNQLLVDWNHTQAVYPALSIHQLFERRVDASPDAIAAVGASSHLTYRGLDSGANKISEHLR